MSTAVNTPYQKLDDELAAMRRDGYTVRVRQLVPVEIDVTVRSNLPVAELKQVALDLAKSGIFRGVRRWDAATPATVVSVTNNATGKPVLGRIASNIVSPCGNN